MIATPGSQVTPDALHCPRVAEFFAGIGLVRMALERAGCRVVFANDIDAEKQTIYAANFDAAVFRRCDVRAVSGADVPDVDIATASFPCTDLSLAGNRNGLRGHQSSILMEFLRVVGEMGQRHPPVMFLENVMGFATSNHGEDLRTTIARLNALGYVCDILALDACRFVPQSRPRLFIIGLAAGVDYRGAAIDWRPTTLRPAWVGKFVRAHPSLQMRAAALPEPPSLTIATLEDVLDTFDPADPIWWGERRLSAFLTSLSLLNAAKLDGLRAALLPVHTTAYRRTRYHKPVWEIRADRLSGCLRTSRGGSSKQAVVEAGQGQVRVRWMTAVEYARLQGAPDLDLARATENQGKFALGDAVCVPVVEWLARHYLIPAAVEALAQRNGVLQHV